MDTAQERGKRINKYLENIKRIGNVVSGREAEELVVVGYRPLGWTKRNSTQEYIADINNIYKNRK